MSHKFKTKNVNHFFLSLCLASMMLLFTNCASRLDHPGEYRVKSNRCFKIGFVYHASVGWDASYEITDSSVVKMYKRSQSYKHPLKVFSSMSGGDEAKGHFKFKTLKPGNSIIKVHHIFRGDIEETDTFNIKIY